MKGILLLILSLASTSAFAGEDQSTDARLERMVQTGAITKEGAAREIKRIHNHRKDELAERGNAQRGIASVLPQLKPLPVIHFRAEPLDLFFED